MDNKKIKRVIAREGLIIIGMAVVVYISLLFIAGSSPPSPKFEAKFTNGDVLDFYVTPKYDYSRKDKEYAMEYIEEWYRPQPARVWEVLQKTIKEQNITSKLISSKCVNAEQLAICRLFTHFLSYNLFVKVLISYFFLLLIRFIIWAVRLLKQKSK